MARTGVTKTPMILLRAHKPTGRHTSELSKTDQVAEKHQESIKGYKKADPSCWMPHPRTGIYFPKGHDHVMDGVPESAASFDQTYWLRNVDGVDKPDHDECYFHPSL
ncbi:hypothetical protein ACSBR1_019714 [Camellia fascicularis]